MQFFLLLLLALGHRTLTVRAVLRCTNAPETECFPGQYCSAEVCTPCAQGTYAPVGTWACTPVSANNYPVDPDYILITGTGAIDQAACGKGRSSSVGNYAACAACPPGKYSDGLGGADSTTSSCPNCVPGKFGTIYGDSV